MAYQENFISTQYREENYDFHENGKSKSGTNAILPFNAIKNQDRDKFGGKATNLALLFQAGLPVPKGFGISNEAFNYFKEHGELPSELVSTLELQKESLGGKVALRSSAVSEDGELESMAGVFTSQYVTKESSLSDALYTIYEQAQSDEVLTYLSSRGFDKDANAMGLVLQELIEPEYAGVIYTGVNEKELLVQYVDGFGARLVDGEMQGSATLIHAETGELIDSTGYENRPLPNIALSQIAEYSQIIKDFFGAAEQDIEFAYSHGQVYIVQARTLTTELGQVKLEETEEDTLDRVKMQLRNVIQKEKTALNTKEVVLSSSNYSELLPHPTQMDFGVFTYIFSGSDGIPGAIQLGRKEMGYKIDDEEVDYMHLIAGKPYFSITLDALTYYAGFPETKKEYMDTFVQDYLDAIIDDPEKGFYPEMGLYVQDPSLQDLESRYGERAITLNERYQNFIQSLEKEAETFETNYAEQKLPEFEKFIDDLQHTNLQELTPEELTAYNTSILEHLRTQSCVDFVKAARLGFYYSQRLQQLLKNDLHMQDEESNKTFSKLTQGLDGSMITDVNLEIAGAEDDMKALSIATKLVGHYSSDEMLEIRHPRLKDNPDALKAYVEAIRKPQDLHTNFLLQKKEREEAQQIIIESVPAENREKVSNVITNAQKYLALRETVKYYFVKEYSLLRDGFVSLNHKLDLNDNDIFYVLPREMEQLLENPSIMHHIITERKKATEYNNLINLPPVIREIDIDSIGVQENNADDFIELKGRFLANGEMKEGVIVNLDEYETAAKLEEVMKEYNERMIPIILAASQINLGHDPYISQSSGIIIENAGIVSHGAQRARELRKGAIAGIRSKLLKSGTLIEFDPNNQTIRRVK